MRAPKELAHRLTTPGAHDAPLSPKLLDYVNNHRLRTVIIGTIGSIMVTLGSYAVGLARRQLQLLALRHYSSHPIRSRMGHHRHYHARPRRYDHVP